MLSQPVMLQSLCSRHLMPFTTAAALIAAKSLLFVTVAKGEAAAATSDVVAKSLQAVSSASSTSLLHSLSHSAPVIGTAWVVSSAILTTYSTTLFLKYPQHEDAPPKKQPQPQFPASLQHLPARSSSGHVTLLQSIPRATLLNFFRFSGSLFLGLLLHVDSRKVAFRMAETWRWIPSFATPAVFLFLANYANSLSLERIGISLTYTSKCGIPLMTVLLTLALDGRGALPNAPALLSLLPIAAGIALASWSAPTFEIPGFVAAVVSTTAQSALNVSSKRVMTRTGVSGPVAQRCMVAVGLLMTCLVSAGQELFRRYMTRPALDSTAPSAPILNRMERGHSTTGMLPSQPSTSSVAQVAPQKPLPPAWLTVLAFTSYHMEYVLSFMFVKLVQPVTYGALDAVRRLGIILTGRAMFGGAPLTSLNRAGIALALLGALGYSVASSG